MTMSKEWDGKSEFPALYERCLMSDGKGNYLPVLIIGREDGFTVGWCKDRREAYVSDQPADFLAWPRVRSDQRQAVIDQAYEVLQRCDVHHSGVAALSDAGMLVAPPVDAEVTSE